MDKRQVYLASYRKESLAMKGFAQIKAKSSALSDAKPVLKSVTLPKKGHFIRLFAEVEGAATADKVCNDLKTVIKDSCAPGRW